MGAALTMEGAEFIVNKWMLWGFIGQLSWAGISAAANVGNEYRTAELLCQTNYSLRNEDDTVTKAITQGVVTHETMKALRDTVNQWNDQLKSLKQNGKEARKQYIVQYTYFLFFLAFITTMFFFALEKKGGRLDRLFAKIDKIDAFAN